MCRMASVPQLPGPYLLGRKAEAAVAMAAAMLFFLSFSWAEEAQPQPEREDFDVHLWPIAESKTLPSGARRNSFLLLFHTTRMPTGELHSYHVLTYFQGPDYKVFFPFGYSVGPEKGKHQGVVPFYFRGPRYDAIPLLLSWRYENAEGVESKWITPLYHRTENPDGTLRHGHLLEKQ